MQSPAPASRLARGCAVLAAVLILSACADNAPTTGTAPSAQARSPLATPPGSMMTPHGY